MAGGSTKLRFFHEMQHLDTDGPEDGNIRDCEDGDGSDQLGTESLGL